MAQHQTAAGRHHDEETLAESENVAVYQCSCGMTHLQIGAVCLTLEPGELAEVGATLLRALDQRRKLAPARMSVVN